jgi:hypothetical protein
MERAQVEFSVSVRTPEQQTAFYAARGFPAAAIQKITATCFLTAGVYNRSSQVVWLELSEWQLADTAGKAVERISRAQWDQSWRELDVPLASRATFGWTQLPESRDLQPGEPVGGNIAVRAPQGPFTLRARFLTGADKSGSPIEFEVRGLRCPEAPRP